LAIQSSNKREIWVDQVRVIACFLVVLGHLLQSLVKAQIVPDGDAFRCFNKIIYSFHVQLFFICSGYLYQRYSIVRSLRGWKQNACKKWIALGIPYLVFSTITWLLKYIFSTLVNEQVKGFVEAILFHPISPYWFLYALLFIFFITPTLEDRKECLIAVAAAIVGRWILTVGKVNIICISYVLENEIWFVIGMVLGINYKEDRMVQKSRNYVLLGGGGFILFLILSIQSYQRQIYSEWTGFGLSILACISVLLFTWGVQNKIGKLEWLTFYTMPIFLMHTLFAAPMRILLMKCGILSLWIHLLAGIAVSFVGPILIVKLAERIKILDFCIYPEKYIKIGR